jgi:hypothetical protein
MLNVATEVYCVYGFRHLGPWNLGFESRPGTALGTSHIYRDKFVRILFDRS